MTHAAYVFGGYLATAAVLGVYVAWLRARARALERMLPPAAGDGAGEAVAGS